MSGVLARTGPRSRRSRGPSWWANRSRWSRPSRSSSPSAGEAASVVRTAVSAVAGRVPVIAGAGGTLGHAIEVAKAASDAGADGLLVLPPYMVSGTQVGLISYVE